jgi:hypothetical protein
MQRGSEGLLQRLHAVAAGYPVVFIEGALEVETCSSALGLPYVVMINSRIAKHVCQMLLRKCEL